MQHTTAVHQRRTRSIGYHASVRLAIFIFILTLTLHARAQWEIEDSHTTASLRGIDSVGGGVAWASGTGGTVLRTEDGGFVWQLCAIPPGAEKLDFRGIQAFDANTAIVMSSGKGDLSRLYKTTDGCQTWKLLFTNSDKNGFWDTLIMTGPGVGMLIGDPIPAAAPSADNPEQHRSVFPTFNTIDGGLKWKRNDHELYGAETNRNGDPLESIFAASNSSMILLPYTIAFVTGGTSTLHYGQYTFERVNGFCEGHGMCKVVTETPSVLKEGASAGGFSLAANWSLSPESTESTPFKPKLHARARHPEAHAVVIVGGDYNLPNERNGTASYCTPTQERTLIRFSCEAAKTPPHGYRSAVAYDAQQNLWITVGPNGTDISRDDGRNWTALKPTKQDAPDADKNWNALSLPFVVGPNGRIGKLRPSALKPQGGS